MCCSGFSPVYKRLMATNHWIERPELSDRQIEEINVRLDKLEKQGIQDIMSLLEIMSSATFFGEMKRKNCEYAKDGQCGFFFLKKDSKGKLPIAADCRIRDCKDMPGHCHLELSNITCTFCPMWRNSECSDSNVLNVDVDSKSIQQE
jgi:hypothetical protein